MNANQEAIIRADFLRWSGGTAPGSPFEIFTYCELTLPREYDKEEARLMLKAWMEKAWQEDPEIENPKDYFNVFLRGNGPGDQT